MELRHLSYFLALASELNFTIAADKMHNSQPPLCRQIMENEKEVGAKLFDRTNRKVILTEEGIYFQSEIKDQLQHLDVIINKTKKISQNLSGPHKISYISSILPFSISSLVNFIGEKYPYLKIKLYEVSTAKQLSNLEEGKLDLAMARAPISSI